MGFPDHPFWDWSLDIYGRPRVEETLLDLQDRLGLDVNLLLFAGWTGATGRGRVAAVDWDRLIEGVAGWRVNVIEPLRAARRHLKGAPEMPGAAVLRGKVKALELEAEHAAQLAIARLAGERGASRLRPARAIADAAANLDGYMAAAGISPADGDRALLRSFAGACCDDPQAPG